MRVLQILNVKKVSGNGVAEAVKQYVKYEDAILWCMKDCVEIPNRTVLRGTKIQCISDIVRHVGRPDIVVFNEVYKKEYIKLYKECLRLDIPYVVIPHGCLAKNAQKQKRLKKTIANILYFKKFLNKASAIQFLNLLEKKESIIKSNRSIIHGNGIDAAEKKHSFPKNAKITYIGRYSINHKGLDLIIDAVEAIQDLLREKRVKINFFGRDSVDTEATLKKLIDDKYLGDLIKIHGPVYGREKKEVLFGTSIFIQASRYEGQPMGIIEALAYGIPCLVTYPTSFGTIVNKSNCGIGVSPDKKEIANGLKGLIECGNLGQKSKNAIKLINDNYKWKRIITDTMKDYERIARGESV